MPDGEELLVRLQTVLATDILLLPASNSNKLPTYWHGQRGSTEDRSINDTTHKYLLAELERREVFDYVESFSDTEPDSDGSKSDKEEDSSSDDDKASEEE